ncbi:MAG: type II toxin-antitoxin system RatA family toxin [Gammaproteobacteria bacterium]|nr:MAG: type II toxin-antitoxin system RatA family toxin [Gammaproteobacteria bacterium]UTW43566.1 type II toxin-antitoxin system RatA family toxin [bacterium SCSIO 12844]
MSKVEKSATVSYSAEAMFNLVNDIEAYSEFLPWCSKAEVLKRTDDLVEGKLYVAKGGFEKSFATRNRLKKNKEMTLELLEGPFKKLYGLWQFNEIDDHSCTVNFTMEFEFSNPFMAMTVGMVFNNIANTMLDAFCKRADEVYGGKA